MDLTALENAAPGTVLLPSDEGFATALSPYAAPGPAAIVRAATVAEVVAVVRYAAAEGLKVAVRSRGHAGPVFSPGPDRILLDLRSLDAITVNDGIVEAGPGASWGAVATEVQKHGLAITSGDTADVGVGGLSLGGGIGWLVRRDGLALDSLVGADVVLASGEFVTASADENPELFWALRGGGGNFGVVTALRFRARPLGAVLEAELHLDPAQLTATLRTLRGVMASAPDELNVTFGVVPNGPPGPGFAFVHHIVAVYAGEDSETSRAAITPLLDLPGVLDSAVRQTDYRGVLAELPGGPGAPLPNVAVRDAMFVSLDDGAIDDALNARAQLGPSVFTIRFLGGAFGRVGPDDTAFAHRAATAIANIVEFLLPGAPQSASRVDAAWAPLAARSIGSYGNFTEITGPASLAAIYPAPTLARLRAIKKQYDPENRFADNHNITPA
ncbi:MAG TPA: FAD-binding protein [Pseudolysinimonas sp.]|nr:FAD-binding protein [Pseudolysinimonas sp.]